MTVIDEPQGSPGWWAARRGIPTASEFKRFAKEDGTLRREQGSFEVKIPVDEARDALALMSSQGVADSRFACESDFKEAERQLADIGRKKYVRLSREDERGLSEGAMGYIAELIAEGIGWQRDEFRGSPDIERGNILEGEARRFLNFETGQEFHETGFCLSDCGRFGSSPDGIADDGTPCELKAPDHHTMIKYLSNGAGVPDDYLTQVHGHLVVTGAPFCWFLAYSLHPQLRPILVKVERNETTERLAESVAEFCDHLENTRKKVLSPDPGDGVK